MIEQNFLYSSLPSFTHLRVEPDNVRPEFLVGMVVLIIGEFGKTLTNFIKTLANTFHLPWLFGCINQTEMVTARATHPFAVPANTNLASFCLEHVVEQDVMGEYDDLTAFGCLLGETLGHGLHTTMVERRNRVIDNDGMITTDLMQFRQEAG